MVARWSLSRPSDKTCDAARGASHGSSPSDRGERATNCGSKEPGADPEDDLTTPARQGSKQPSKRR